MLWYVDHHGPCTSQRRRSYHATLDLLLFLSPSPFVHPRFYFYPAHGLFRVYRPFLHSLSLLLPCKLYSNKNICFNQLISASTENMAPPGATVTGTLFAMVIVIAGTRRIKFRFANRALTSFSECATIVTRLESSKCHFPLRDKPRMEMPFRSRM